MQAMVGICSCGESGCGSLWMVVHRENHLVVWEPDPNAPRSSIDTTWRFELRQYLDAVDDGHRSTVAWETRPQLFARDLRRRRDSLFGFGMGNSRRETGGQLLDVRCWPDVYYVTIRLAEKGGVREYQIPIRSDQTDEEIRCELRDFDPSRYRSWG